MKPNKINNLLILIIVLLAGCLGQVASDIYSPALSLIATHLHSTISLAQTSMASYMIGMAVSMIFYGIWSEGVGRRTPLITGLILTIAGLIICYFSTSMTMLIIGRFITGCGTGAASSLWRSVFRDCYSGDKMAKYGSYLSVGIIFLIPTAPAIGGFVSEYLGWRAIFALLIAYSVLVLLVVHMFLPETNKSIDKQKLRLPFIIQSMQEILANRHFSGALIAVFLTYGAFFTWYSAGSALLVHHLNMTPSNFGLLNLVGAASATVIASLINARLVEHLGTQAMLRLAWSLCALAGSLMLALGLAGFDSIASIYGPAVIFYLGCSFVWPNTFATAMKPFGHISGIAGSTYGFMQILGGGLIGLLAAHMPSNSQIPLAILLTASPILALVSFEFITRPHTQTKALS